MKVLIFILFLLNKISFSFKNKFLNLTKHTTKLRLLNIINNVPVDNNIPIIIHDPNPINNNNDNSNTNIIDPNTNLIPAIVPNNKIKIVTNTSIKINTTNMDPMCTVECCMGCRVQFQKLILQKNCITTICKCQIIENENINVTMEEINNSNITEDKTFLMLMDNKNKFNNTENIEGSISYIYYFLVILIFIIYEIYILKRLSYKGRLFNCNDDSYKKDKENRLKDYMDLIYEDEELIECLI